MELWRILRDPDNLPPPADRCGHCGQQRIPLATIPVQQHREVFRNRPIEVPQTPNHAQQGGRTLERTHQRSNYDPNLAYSVNSSGPSAEASRTSNRHWTDNVELCIDYKSGTHAAQVKRNNNARASERSRRKRKGIMKRLEEAEKEIQRYKEDKQTDAELLRERAELLRKKDAENERLRQQLEKQAQR
ncbi:hypothetical protein E4U15_007506 [Claviceps sp. LM218 group G6]|nr:hypothetical protein E4U15_007506 [Claviceps sp. LM218 group G6]